jgi:hypothetical protein
MIWFDEALFAQREKGFCGGQIGVQPQFRAKLVARFTSNRFDPSKQCPRRHDSL